MKGDHSAVMLEARLTAIEHLLANAYATLYRATGATLPEVRESHARLMEAVSADADADEPCAAETIEALTVLLGSIAEMVEADHA